MKNVLIACEESQTVCKAFREKGFNAYSCDVVEPSGGHPEWHFLGDVLEILNPYYKRIKTMDGKPYFIRKWDLIIAHPPCTHLAVSGIRWFKEGKKDIKLQEQAINFFMEFVNVNCEHVAIENPVCIMSTKYRKPDQIINPWQFGHTEQKKTCLWLKGLPKLKETNNVYKDMILLPEKERCKIWYMGSHHSKERSKTYKGFALAMADQWGAYLINER